MLAGARRLKLRLKIAGQRVDRSEGAARLGLVGNGHLVLALDGHRQLQRVDRVEAEALLKQRLIILDLLVRQVLQGTAGDDQLLELTLQIVQRLTPPTLYCITG